MDFPERFRVARFDFLISPKERMDLPQYLSSVLRGEFSQAFKKISCGLKDKKCPPCILKENCAYSSIFETPLPEGKELARRYSYAPYPFVLEPPLERISAHNIGFGLVLIGRAINYLPHFIYAFSELGRTGTGRGRGKFQLIEVKSERKTIYSSSKKILHKGYREVTGEAILSDRQKGVKRLEFHFLTPTRMIADGKLASKIDFPLIIHNAIQRILLLSYFHCGEEMGGDLKGLKERAKGIALESSELSWYNWDRLSKKQRKKLKLGGFIGSATFSGELDEFLPYLTLGEHVHIGKGTLFGLGRYRLRDATSS